MSKSVKDLLSKASNAIEDLGKLVEGGDTEAHKALGNLYDQLENMLEDQDFDSDDDEEDEEEDEDNWSMTMMTMTMTNLMIRITDL